MSKILLKVSLLASAALPASAWAVGACVYTDTRHAARLTICVDNVANQAACNQMPGVNNTFFPGKTCAQLKAANQSNSNVSMGADLTQAIAMIERQGRARMPVRFVGTDVFTDHRLRGTSVSYTGGGTAILTRNRENPALLNIAINDLHIRITGFRPGEVSPRLAEQMARNIRTATIPRSQVTGILHLDRERQAYVVNLEQHRVVRAQGFIGAIDSKGHAVIGQNARDFQLIGTGLTLHPLLFEQDR